MRFAVTAALAALAFAAPAAGRAQPPSPGAGPGPDTWLDLHVGAFFPQHRDLAAVDPGLDLGGNLGARFSAHLGVDVGVGFVRASGSDQASGTKLTASDVPFTASLRLRAPYRFVELSAAAGVGLHVATLSTGVPTTTGAIASTSDTSIALGFQLGAGLAFAFWPTMLVGAEVQRSFAEPRFRGTGVRFDGLRAAATITYRP